jgi:ankyrin repeat protein
MRRSGYGWKVSNTPKKILSRYLILSLERGVDGNVHDMYETILLHSAANQGTPEVVETLLNRGLKSNAKDRWGETVLHSVSRGKRGSQGGVRVAKILLERGADVNTRRKNDWTPLHFASYFGNVEIVRLLLDHGANLDAATGNMGEKPLHKVSYGKYRYQEDGVRVAQLLFDRGAEVNTRGKDDWTPLHRASYYGNVEIVRLLLDHGADLDAATGNSGDKPLHSVSLGEYRSEEDGVRVAQLLFDRGADVNTRSKDSWTPLHVASYYGNVEIVRLLLDHGADLDGRCLHSSGQIHQEDGVDSYSSTACDTPCHSGNTDLRRMRRMVYVSHSYSSTAVRM